MIGQQGDKPRRLTSHAADEGFASWSGDGRWVYFASNRTGTYQVWKIPVAGGSAIQVTRKGGYRPVESPDGRFVYYCKGRRTPDVWKVLLAGGKEVPVFEGLKSTWTVAGTGLYFYATQEKTRPGNQWSIKLYDLETGRQDTIVELNRKPQFSASPAVSSDGGAILFVHEEKGSSDLMRVENFQ